MADIPKLLRRNITPADMVLLMLLIAANGALYALPVKPSSGIGEMVQISNAATGDKTSYPLSQDRLLQIPGSRGEVDIEINQGQARFIAAPCSKKICIHAGWLQTSGQWAACLENGISMQILGTGQGYDSISY